MQPLITSAASQVRHRAHQLLIAVAAFAVFAAAVRRNGETERRGAQVRDLAEKIDRRFRIIVLQLAIGRAHPARRLHLAIRAFGQARPFLVAHRLQALLPTVTKAARAQSISGYVREHTDAHLSFRVDGETVDPSAAPYFIALCDNRNARVLRTRDRVGSARQATISRV